MRRRSKGKDNRARCKPKKSHLRKMRHKTDKQRKKDARSVQDGEKKRRKADERRNEGRWACAGGKMLLAVVGGCRKYLLFISAQHNHNQ